MQGQTPTVMFVLEQREMGVQFTCELPLDGLASKDVENPEKKTSHPVYQAGLKARVHVTRSA